MKMSNKLHYSLIEWKAYRDNLVNNDKIEKMQNHLLECDECMENYLLSMDYLEEGTLQPLVPKNFTEEVMEVIHEENKKILMLRRKSAKSKLIAYYVSAACVTLFLLSSGVFASMFNSFSKLSIQISTVSSKAESIFTSGWTDKLVHRTSGILNITFKN
jgi:hypothetical protein